VGGGGGVDGGDNFMWKDSEDNEIGEKSSRLSEP